MLLLLSLATATADADAAMIACEGMYVASVLPAAGAQNVPLDALVTVQVAGDCGAPPYYDVALYGPGDVLVAEDRFDQPQTGERLVIDPAGLESATDYRVAITPGEGWGEVSETTFRTGTGAALPLDGAPSLVFEDLTWSRRDAVVSAMVQMVPADDPYGGLIEVRDESNTPVGWGTIGQEDTLWTWFTQQAVRSPSQVCAQPFQIRVTGEEIPGELVCEAPDRERGPLGCSTAASPMGLLPLLAGLLLIRRRK